MTSNHPPLFNMGDSPAASGAEADDAATHLELELNGTRLSLEADPTLPLLKLLREKLDLTGTKKGCDSEDQ